MVNALISRRAPYKPSRPPPPSQPTPPTLSHESRVNSRIRFPRLDGGTQPRRQESIFEFLKRREADRVKLISSEGPTARQSRLAREENASKHRPPGRKGARVYYWDLIEGVRVRTPVGRNNYEDIWERYGQHQKHYDSVADEWDICTELDPDDGPDYPDDSVLDRETEHNTGTASSLAYLERLHPVSSSSDRVVFNDTVDDVVRHRFGFTLRSNVSDRSTILSEKIWNKALGLIGCGRPPRLPIHDMQAASRLCTFLFDMLKATHLYSAPQNFDLVSLRPRLPFELDVLPSRNGLYFIIQAPEAHDNEPFVLAFSSAGTVMEIARRRWGPKTTDIVQRLIQEGFSFNTLSPYLPPTNQVLPPQRRSVVLGRRPSNFNPGLAEYLAYEYRRNSFLRSTRGRAAILAGGIIARLARRIVDENDVFDGPTDEALHGQQALCVWDKTQPAAFWDDSLSEDEVDLICGSYEVATGKSFLRYQRAHHTNSGARKTWPKRGDPVCFQILVATAYLLEELRLELRILV
ncbi:hypothetical protein F5879DRAFT_811883 [Lentinula edodes]|nr:hypothetical protein F5879DRAFT_811883 [Lentinula edodes]